METSGHAWDAIETLLTSEALGVLSTEKKGRPYASLVAVAASDDFKHLLFATPRTTRKYGNLTANPWVALLVNNSRNLAQDIYGALSVTALGTAETLEGSDREALLEIYLKRHPHLKSFAGAPTNALVRVDVERYILVSRFQNVTEVEVVP